jgi:hypothetical protein
LFNDPGVRRGQVAGGERGPGGCEVGVRGQPDAVGRLAGVQAEPLSQQRRGGRRRQRRGHSPDVCLPRECHTETREPGGLPLTLPERVEQVVLADGPHRLPRLRDRLIDPCQRDRHRVRDSGRIDRHTRHATVHH